MTHNHEYNLQKNQLGKKIVSIGLVTALAACSMPALFKSCNKDKTKVETVAEQTTSDVQQDDLLLSDDFDINDQDAVRKRAEEIYNISEKKFSIEEIVNMIYLANEQYNSINFPGQEDQVIAKYINTLRGNLLVLLGDNLTDDVNAIIEEGSINSDYEIYSYMFLANGNGKLKAKEIAKIVIEQLENIKNQKSASYEETANKFYNKYEEVKSSELSDGAFMIIFKDFTSKAALFTFALTNDQVKIIDENYGALYDNSVGFAANKALGVNMDSIIGNGDPCVDASNNSANNNAEADRIEAEKYIDSSTSTTKAESGGKHVGTTSSVVPGTTSSSTEEEVVSSKEESYTQFIPGGQPVGDPEVVTETVSISPDNYVEYEEEVVGLNGKQFSYSVPTTIFRDADSLTRTKTLR